MPAPALTKLQKIILVALAIILSFGAYLFLKPSHSVTVAGTQLSTSGLAKPKAISDEQMNAFLLQYYKGEARSGAQYMLVARVGEAIATRNMSSDNPRPLHFHLLNEPNVINIFAVPTGNVYVTTALVNRMRTEGQLAAALASGAAHVFAGDRMTFTGSSQLQFTVAQETAADSSTIKLMANAGYDPQAFLGMFAVLTDAYQAKADVPFFATHPSAEWRLSTIDASIKALYPKGIPAVLSK